MGDFPILNRIIWISGIVVLTPFLNGAFHNVFQEQKIPPRIMNLLESRSPTQNIRGFVELAYFKGDLSEAVPIIEKGLRSEEIGIRQATEYMLTRSDSRLLDDLKPLLESDDFDRYRFGCDMAFAIGQPSAKYVDLVSAKINNADFGDKKEAYNMASLLALRGMGPKAKPAIKQIVACLDSRNIHVVLYACKVIIEMGPEGKEAATKLIDIVKNGNASTRGWAGQALARIGVSKDYDVVKILAPRLEAYNTLERERVLEGVAGLGGAAKSQLKLIKELMEEEKFHTQPHAAYAYFKISGESEQPVKILTELATKLNTREQAIEMLGRIGPDASSATNILIKYVELDPEEITLRELAVIALGRIGPKAKDSLPALEELVNTELDWLLRIRAVEAIDKIKGKKALGQSRGDAALIK